MRSLSQGPPSSLALLVRSVLVRAQVPCVDQVALCGINLALLLDVLDADPQAVFGEDDVLLAHLFRDIALYLRDAQVDLVADPGGPGGDGEEDDERNELAGGVREGISAKEVHGARPDSGEVVKSTQAETLEEAVLPLPCPSPKPWRLIQASGTDFGCQVWKGVANWTGGAQPCWKSFN